MQCNDAQWCDYPGNDCGNGPALVPPECRSVPGACPDLALPVCGCDGTVYSNECEANDAGVDVDAAGNCTPPPGMFACGFLFCDTMTQYCIKFVSDVPGQPDDYACSDLPPECGGGLSGCDCLKGVECGDMCAEVDGGGRMVTCPGG